MRMKTKKKVWTKLYPNVSFFSLLFCCWKIHFFRFFVLFIIIIKHGRLILSVFLVEIWTKRNKTKRIQLCVCVERVRISLYFCFHFVSFFILASSSSSTLKQWIECISNNNERILDPNEWPNVYYWILCFITFTSTESNHHHQENQTTKKLLHHHHHQQLLLIIMIDLQLSSSSSIDYIINCSNVSPPTK